MGDILGRPRGSGVWMGLVATGGPGLRQRVPHDQTPGTLSVKKEIPF